jgi:ubiquinone/menaquinone biosynthesis C-methylase UbiE
VVERDSTVSSYSGRHAELYDLFYGEKPYRQEAEFVHSRIQQFGMGDSRRLLELACGTGSHALMLEELGYEVTATDYSIDMLQRARDKAANRHSKVKFQMADMRDLPAPDVGYDAVVCLFDSLGYVETNESLERVLRGVHRVLRKEGLLVVEFWHAAAMLKSYDPLRIRRWTTPDREIVRVAETKLDIPRQVANVTYSVYELKNDGSYSSFTETQGNRYFLVQEMAGWLSACRLVPLKWYSGFTEDEDIGDHTWHVLAVARSQ